MSNPVHHFSKVGGTGLISYSIRYLTLCSLLMVTIPIILCDEDDAIRLQESNWIDLYNGFEKAATLITDDDGDAAVNVNFDQGARIGERSVKKLYISLNGLISFNEPFRFPNPITNAISKSFPALSTATASGGQTFDAKTYLSTGQSIPQFATLIAPFWTDLVTVPPSSSSPDDTSPDGTKRDRQGGEYWNAINSGLYYRCFNHEGLMRHLPTIEPQPKPTAGNVTKRHLKDSADEVDRGREKRQAPPLDQGSKSTQGLADLSKDNSTPPILLTNSSIQATVNASRKISSSLPPVPTGIDTIPTKLTAANASLLTDPSISLVGNLTTKPNTTVVFDVITSISVSPSAVINGSLNTGSLPQPLPGSTVKVAGKDDVLSNVTLGNNITSVTKPLESTTKKSILNLPLTSRAFTDKKMVEDPGNQKNPKINGDSDVNECSSGIPADIRNTVANLIRQPVETFQPLFMLVVTWSNLTSFATRETMKNSTLAIFNFQSILVIESDWIYIVFHYKHGGMRNLWNQFISDLKIGYGLFGSPTDTYFMPNISLIQDAEGIENKYGNTGLPGIYYYRIKMQSHFGMKCYEAFDKFRNHNISLGTKGYNDCPCTLGMAKMDARYDVQDNCATLQTRINIQGFKYTPVCCYGEQDETLLPTYPSRFKYDDRLETDNATSYLWNSCCQDQNSSNLCQFYYQIQGYVSCQTYEHMNHASITDSFYMIPIKAPTGYFYNADGMYRIFESDLCHVQGIWFYKHMIFQNITYKYPILKHVAFQVFKLVVDIIYNEGSQSENIFVDGNIVSKLPYQKGILSIYSNKDGSITVSNYLYVGNIKVMDGSLQLKYSSSPKCFTNQNLKTSLLTLIYDNQTNLFTPPEIPTLKMNASVDFENFHQFGKSCQVSQSDAIFKHLDIDEEQFITSPSDVRDSIGMGLIVQFEPIIKNMTQKYQAELDVIKYKDSHLYYQCLLAFLIRVANHQDKDIMASFDSLVKAQNLARRIFSIPNTVKIIGPHFVQAEPGVVSTYDYTFNYPDHDGIRLQVSNTNGKLQVFPNGTFTYEPVDFSLAYIRISVYDVREGTILSDYQPNVLLSQCLDKFRTSPFMSQQSLVDIPPFLREASLGLYRPVECECVKWRFGPHCSQHYCGYGPCFKGAACVDFNNETDSTYTDLKCPACPIYSKGDGFKCEDVDECAMEPPVCDTNASVCINSFPFYNCKCNPGYEPGDRDLKCQAIACDRPEKACPQGFKCIDKFGNGTKECVCPKGTQLTDNVCLDINECQSGNVCGEHAECINLKVGYECACHHGYYKTSPKSGCYDINECDRLMSIFRSNCSQDCYNKPGSYQCACYDAFVPKPDSRLDLGVCLPKVPCTDPKKCLDDGFCAQVLQRDKCYCQPGYLLAEDGVCLDIDECKLPENLCRKDPKANCANTPGSYYCTCVKGYIWNDSNFTCSDVNECLLGEEFTNCHHPAYCMNEPGSFYCECPPTLGYHLENGTCSPKTTCGTVQCGLNSHCEARWSSVYDAANGTYIYTAEELCVCDIAFFTTAEKSVKNPNFTQVPIAIQLKLSLYKDYTASDLDATYTKNYSLLSQKVHRPICHALEFIFKEALIACQVQNITDGSSHEPTDGRHRPLTNVSLVLGFSEGVRNSGLLGPDNLNFIPDILSNSFGWPHPSTKAKRATDDGLNYYLPTTAIRVDPASLEVQDLDECQGPINKCPRGVAQCINTFGGYECVCKSGFRNVRHWLVPGVYVCQDIDECEENLANCSSWDAMCINTPGGYICQCPPGFGTLNSGDTVCIPHGRNQYWKNFAILSAVILGILGLLLLISLIMIFLIYPKLKQNMYGDHPAKRPPYGSNLNDTESFSTKIPRPHLKSNLPPFTENDDISDSQVCIRSPRTQKAAKFSYTNPIAYQGSSIITHF